MPDITQTFSQLLLTYGPGAMLDLPDHAVVVAGSRIGATDRIGGRWRSNASSRCCGSNSVIS